MIDKKPDVAISARGVAKQYLLGGAEQHYESFRDLLRGVLTSPFRKARTLKGEAQTQAQLFWALDDVSFDIPEGQVTAIIGRNGAGKSTLLKVLSRITPPTKGEIKIRGRVASLLEVGSGFHPELTGRENIYMNASILGMSKAEVTRKLDDIVQFAEVEKFLDTPVKRYSSGMYVRLAFSVAAHVDPDVLLIDEVLAVGDARFQKRCIGKLSEVSKQGRTVVFVSHNMGLIQELCSHSIYLKNGCVESYGPTNVVLSNYMQDGAEAHGEWQASSSDQTIQRVIVKNQDGQRTSSISYNEVGSVEIEVLPDRQDSDFIVALRITDELGRDILTSWDSDSLRRSSEVGERYVSKCQLPNSLLRPGQYFLTVMVRNSKHGFIERIDEASISLEITNIGFKMNEERFGLVLPELTWDSLND